MKGKGSHHNNRLRGDKEETNRVTNKEKHFIFDSSTDSDSNHAQDSYARSARYPKYHYIYLT